MSKMVQGLFFLAALTCYPTAPKAQLGFNTNKFDGFFFYKGESFYKLCTSGNADTQGACAAYVCGAVDAWSAEYVVTGKKYYSICLPTGATCGVATNAVIKFLTDNPSIRASAAAGAIGYALQKTFPCRGGAE